MHQFVDQEQFDKIFAHAYIENDTVIYHMLMTYCHSPTNRVRWEDFLVDLVLALSAASKASQEHLLEVLSKQSSVVLMPIANVQFT